MANPYHKIEEKMRYVTGHCPRCQFGKVKLNGLVMKCRNCGATFDPDERAFMKMRNHPDGCFVPKLRHFSDGLKIERKRLKRGRRKKMYKTDKKLIEMVIMSYRGGINMKRISERYSISYSTVSRMINKNYGSCG